MSASTKLIQAAAGNAGGLENAFLMPFSITIRGLEVADDGSRIYVPNYRTSNPCIYNVIKMSTPYDLGTGYYDASEEFQSASGTFDNDVAVDSAGSRARILGYIDNATARVFTSSTPFRFDNASITSNGVKPTAMPGDNRTVGNWCSPDGTKFYSCVSPLDGSGIVYWTGSNLGSMSYQGNYFTGNPMSYATWMDNGSTLVYRDTGGNMKYVTASTPYVPSSLGSPSTFSLPRTSTGGISYSESGDMFYYFDTTDSSSTPVIRQLTRSELTGLGVT